MKCLLVLAGFVMIGLVWSHAVIGADEATDAANVTAGSKSTSDKLAALDGAKVLFDGKTLDGWTQIPADSWTVKDDAMASKGTGRGVIYTNDDYSKYRLMFSIRHVGVEEGKKDHQACVLIFCQRPDSEGKPLDALGGIQFQVPNGGHWDYRKGHNNDGKGEFTSVNKTKYDPHQWSRVEILVDADTGAARMAVAQPIGSKAVEVVDFNLADAGRKGPIAWQIHNGGLLDEYKDVSIEVDPKSDELISTK